MPDGIAKAKYHRAIAELLTLAVDSVELYDRLLKETEIDNPMRDSYKASADGWRQTLDKLLRIF